MIIRNGFRWTVSLAALACLAGTPLAAAAQGGTCWGWGINAYGEVGDGTTTVRHIPVKTVGLKKVIAISAAGGYGAGIDLYTSGHSLAVTSDGNAWGWGDNSFGDVGDGTTTVRHSPVQVVGLSNVTAISAGSSTFLNNGTNATGHSLALESDGSVWSWGFNYYGQLGYGSQDSLPHSTPAQVPGLPGVIAIAAGEDDSFALTSDGTVWSWGLNDYGQLGDGTTTVRSSPVQVIGLTDVVGISAGFGHCLALKSDGTVWSWGLNNYGQLGDGTTTVRTTPVQVIGLTNVTAVSAGGDDFVAIPLWAEGFSLALKSDGTVWSWGLNNYGQLGDGTTTVRTTPVQVTGLSHIVAISAGGAHGLALSSKGVLAAWGLNNYGQLGDGTTTVRHAPVKTRKLKKVRAISAGAEHSLAITAH